MKQKFTGYIRDGETDLDFAQARMYSKNYGRFTTSDPLLSSGRIESPQTWNRYIYVLNNPMILIDPLGLYECKAGKTNCEKFDAALEKARANLMKIEKKYGGKESKEYIKAESALGIYGKKDEKNGITIFSNEGAGEGRTYVEGVLRKKTDENPTGRNIIVAFDTASFGGENFDSLIGHEGSHAADGTEWVKSNFSDSKNPSNYQSESDAYTVSSLLSEARGDRSRIISIDNEFDSKRPAVFPFAQIWNSSWAAADVATMRQHNINKLLEYDKIYKLTPADTTKLLRKGVRFK